MNTLIPNKVEKVFIMERVKGRGKCRCKITTVIKAINKNLTRQLCEMAVNNTSPSFVIKTVY